MIVPVRSSNRSALLSATMPGARGRARAFVSTRAANANLREYGRSAQRRSNERTARAAGIVPRPRGGGAAFTGRYTYTESARGRARYMLVPGTDRADGPGIKVGRQRFVKTAKGGSWANVKSRGAA